MVLTRQRHASPELDEVRNAVAYEVSERVMDIRQKITRQFDISPKFIGFTAPCEFPRTSSGKVQRRLCTKALEGRGELRLLELPGCTVFVPQREVNHGHR